MRALVGAALVAVVVAAVPGPVNGSFPGENGRIAFVRSVSGDTRSGLRLEEPANIYTVRPDGSDLRRLFRDGAFDREPAWSPDGSQLAFVRRSPPPGDDRHDLYVVNADGSGLRRLTQSVWKGVTWSPDGSRIAFSRDGRLWTIEVESRRVRRVTRTPAERPAWSPDGRWIAYFAGGYDVAERVRPDGTGRRRLGRLPYYRDKFGVAEELDWTPSGRLAYVGGDGLTTMDASGGRRRLLFDGDAADPAWSPDGRWVAINVFDRVGQDDYSHRLQLLRADGGETRTLTPALRRTWDADPSWQPLCTRQGGNAADTLVGTATRDVVCGAGGGDVLRGGAGGDRLFGGEGDDRLFVRDGGFDVVGCGPGRDVVLADHRDLLGVDCEVARRAGR
jgi:Tol biopolymer transport system component